MAEIWPGLRKKLTGDGRKKKKSSKSKKCNPYAATGLSKFAVLLEGLQATKTSSLVERTASSVSAARSLSRSAQEWTATTLTRSASRRSETKLLHCAARPGVGQVSSRNCTEPGFEARKRNSVEVESAGEDVHTVGKLQRDLENSNEARQCQGIHEEAASASLGVRLPVRCGSMKKIRSLNRQGWRQTSNSAFVLLLALGAFISSRIGKVGTPLAAVLTFSAVIRVWRKGKVYARFMFSSIVLYFLAPLQSYLTSHVIPRRLSMLPRKSYVTLDTDSRLSTEEQSQTPHIDLVQECPPLSILLPIPESPASTPAIEPLPASVHCKKSTVSPRLSRARRLAKKISSRFKKLKICTSSSSSSTSSVSLPNISESFTSGIHYTATSEPGSPLSPLSPSHPSGASSPDRRRMCPFSRRLHGDDATSHSLRSCLRRQKSSEIVSDKKSRSGMMLSSETLERYNVGESMASTSSSSTTKDDSNTASQSVSWPVIGLLVTLLFLLVGRLPAIMATSLFFVVVSNAHHDRAHHRALGRDIRALEAARKLHRSPPPRGRGSPLGRF